MARFSYTQTKIALALLKGEKSVLELSKILGESNARIERELKEMLGLNLVEKKGDSFALKKEIVEEIMQRREIEEQDNFKVRLKAFIETQALSDKLIRKHLASVETNMKKDPDFVLYNVEIGEPIKQGDYYSGFIEVNFSARNFSSIIRFVLMYAPSVIEIVKPPKAEFTAFDLQEGLMDLTNWVYKYNSFINQHMKREEIERFNKSLFQQKKK